MSKGARGQGGRGAGGLVVLGCLALLALVLLWPAVLHPRWWLWKPGAPHSDLAITRWPNAHFTRRSLWEDGKFPLWRPTIMSGTPFAASPSAGLCYPLNWLLLFLPWLPLELGFNLSAFVHLWLAGSAMYTLMRRGFGSSIEGALAAAVVYEASPKLLAHLSTGHIGWTQAWAWLPIVTLCWLKALDEANESGKLIPVSPCGVIAGVTLTLQAFTHPQMAGLTLIAVSILFLAWTLKKVAQGITGSNVEFVGAWEKARMMASRLLSVVPKLSFVISFVVVFLGLAACRWVPLVALLPALTRSSMTLHEVAVYSLPWRYLTGLLLADHGGFYEWMTYVGVSTLVMATIGLRALWRERENRWWLGWLVVLLIGAGWFSLGENGGLFQVLYRVVPGLGLLRVPPRAWVLVVFATAVLAGFGVEAGEQRTRRTRWRRALPLMVGAFPPMLVAGYWLTVGKPPLNLIQFGIVTPLTVVLATIRHASRSSAIHHSPFIIRHSLFAILLIAVDLLIVDITFIEARSPEKVFADGCAVASWLAARSDDRFRVYSPSYSIPQHVAERYDLNLADGVDPLQLQVYADYLTRAAGLQPDMGYSVTLPPFPEGSDVRTALKSVTPNTKMLGQLGVRYVAAAFPIAHSELHLVGQFDDVYLYRNEDAQPTPITPERSIILADGTTLFRYRPWPVYVGWAISGLTALGLLSGWVMGRVKDS